VAFGGHLHGGSDAGGFAGSEQASALADALFSSSLLSSTVVTILSRCERDRIVT
jgi:hypothetical protein